MLCNVSFSGHHMISQKLSLTGELSKDIFTSKFWARKKRRLTRVVCFLIVLNLIYHPMNNGRVGMLLEPSHNPANTSFLILFSRSGLSDPLQLHILQHTVLPCPSNCPQFAQIHIHWVDDVLLPSHPLLFLSPLPSIFPRIRVFPSDTTLGLKWQNYWLLPSTISPFRNSQWWFHSWLNDLISLLSMELSSIYFSPPSCKTFILWHSVLMVPLSPPYMTTGKPIALTVLRFSFIST